MVSGYFLLTLFKLKRSKIKTLVKRKKRGKNKTRSQAVAGIADRTASQQTIYIASSAVFEILGSKRIMVTSLTLQGHVTSSVSKRLVG